MASRRIFLAAAGTSLVLVQRAAGLLAAEMELADGIPSGAAAAARLEALPGKMPLIKLTYRPPNYETPFPISTRHHAERRLLRPLSSCRYSRGRSLRLAAQGRRRAAGEPVRADPRPAQRELRAGRDGRRLPMLRQPARPVRAARAGHRSGVWAPWATPAGKARGSRTCWPRPGSGKRWSRSPSTAPTGRCSTRRPTSSRACRCGRRSRRRRSSPTR